ncbi:MAG TPA: hypothetical protein VNE39_06840 [Planctomycetota bacterium]|nr:hypothetical protein [Planctomycetota bacterium]
MVASALRDICSEFRRRLRAAQGIAGLSRAAMVALAAGAALILLDWWLRFGTVGRLVSCSAFLAAAAAAAWLWMVRPLRERWSDAHVLAFLDRTVPGGPEGLLVLAELGEPAQIPEAGSEQGRAMIESARERLSPLVREVALGEAIRHDVPRRWARRAAGAVLLAGLAFAVTLPHSTTGLGRLLLPLADIPWPQKTRLTIIEPAGPMPPGGWPTPRGEPFRLRVRLGGQVVPREVELAYRGAGRWIREALRVDPDDTCTVAFPEVTQDILFTLRANDAETDRLRIRVVERPAVAKVVAIYQYPLYSRLPPKRVESGAISALEGSRVTLLFTANQELARAELVFRLKPKDSSAAPGSGVTRHAARVAHQEGRSTFAHTLTLTTSGLYEVRLEGLTGLAQGEPEVYPIQVIPDEPPVAQTLAPTEDGIATPRGRLKVSVRATDDFGLTQVEFRYQINGGEHQALSDRVTGPLAQQGKTSQADFTWDLQALGAKPGDQLTFHLWARDCNPSGTGVGESPRLRIAFRTPTELQMQVVLQAKAMLTEAKTAYEQQKYAALDAGHWLAGTPADPTTPIEPSELLRRARLEQDYAGRAAQAVGYHMGELRAQIEANQMQREFMSRRLDQIAALLHPVAGTMLPAIEGAFAAGEPASAEEAAPAKALAKMQAAARAAQPRQREATLALYRVYAYVADWSDLQSVLVKTARLAEQQSEVHAATLQITPKFKGKELEDLDEKSVEELATIGQQQHAIYEAERALEAELARLIVKSERERRKAIYVALMTAFKGLKSHLVNDQMRQSAMAIADNRPHTILDAQLLAVKGLTWVRDGLVRAGDELPPGIPFTEEDIAAVLADDRLRPAGEEVVEAAADDFDLTAAAVAEPAEVKAAETLEYALQLWQERQARLLDRTRHIHAKLGERKRSPRYARLKMGMLALHGGELEAGVADAVSRAAEHPCRRVGPRVSLLADEARAAVALAKAGKVGPGPQRLQLGVAEGVKDLRLFLEARAQVEALVRDHKASDGKDSFGRAYLLSGEDLGRAAGMVETLGWTTLLHRDAGRKASPVPAGLAPEDRALCETDIAKAARLAEETLSEVTRVSGAVEQFGDDIRGRLAEWAKAHLAALKPLSVPAEPDADLQKEFARVARQLQQATNTLRDLLDERVHTEVPVPEEERVPQAPEIVQVKPADLANPEVLEKMREELLKYEEPPALIKRIEESTAIPEEYKPTLIEALKRPVDAKYRELVTAYFDTIARCKK